MDFGALGVYICLFTALYFEVFLLISYLEKKPSEKTDDLPNYYPTVSILVPCFNEEKTLEHTVHSLLELHYPKDKLDIFIIDDGSKDGTRAIGERMARSTVRCVFCIKKTAASTPP